jgi:hypothetical protein
MHRPIDPGVPSGNAATLGPMCRACGRYTRLSHVAPHDTLKRTDVRTFACECGQEMSQTVAL